ncbi:hypothetical protein N3K66_005247 [Trichothecium roseum]|uniref:Uncharacterized protein n=1 Tax=Trichothecium roseum TaxID=47278 RepID=A0ACC0V3L8_9HYPO|nr:hypothetical protein N3K66_005247 [Trichothecium roseum]
MSKLEGTRALVIGGTSGIGFGVASALLSQGAHVTISSSSAAKVSSAVSRLEAAHPAAASAHRIAGHPCDLADQATLTAQVAQLFALATAEGAHKLDHVVMTAGDLPRMGTLESFSFHDVIQTGMLRFFAPFVVAQHLRANLNPGPASSFTMTTGSSMHRPTVGWSLVTGYFGGAAGLGRSLAKELAPIRVNVVEPGSVQTELWDTLQANLGGDDGRGAKVKESFADRTATGRVGCVEDVAESYLYLIRDRNVTASVIQTNGGTLIM